MKLSLKDKICFTILGIFIITGFTLAVTQDYKYSKLTSDDLTTTNVVYDSYTRNKGAYGIITDKETYIIDKSLILEEELNDIDKDTILTISYYKKTIMTLTINGEEIINLEDSTINYDKDMKTIIYVFLGVIVLIIIMIIVANTVDKKLNNPTNYTYTKVKFKEEIHYSAYQKIKNSITKKDSFYYGDILEYYETDELNYTLYKLMIDYIDDDKIYLFIDNGELNEGFAWVAYKQETNLLLDVVYKNNDTNKYELSIDLFWFYPDEETTLEEQEKYIDALDLFISENEDKISIIK